MRETIKDINTITSTFAILLKDIVDTGDDLMHPEYFFEVVRQLTSLGIFLLFMDGGGAVV